MKRKTRQAPAAASNRNMNVTVPLSLYQEARLLARARGLTLSAFIRDVLRRELVATKGGAER